MSNYIEQGARHKAAKNDDGVHECAWQFACENHLLLHITHDAAYYLAKVNIDRRAQDFTD